MPWPGSSWAAPVRIDGDPCKVQQRARVRIGLREHVDRRTACLRCTAHDRLDVRAPPRQARGRARQAPTDAMPLFAAAQDAPAQPHPAVERLRATDLDSMTPLQAFDLLRTLKEQSRDA